MKELPAIDDARFAETVTQSSVPVLVEFFSASCGTCKMLQHTLGEIQEELGGKIRVVKMDAAACEKTTVCYEIFGVPTTLLFIGGEKRGGVYGPQQKDDMLRRIAEVVKGGN